MIDDKRPRPLERPLVSQFAITRDAQTPRPLNHCDRIASGILLVHASGAGREWSKSPSVGLRRRCGPLSSANKRCLSWMAVAAASFLSPGGFDAHRTFQTDCENIRVEYLHCAKVTSWEVGKEQLTTCVTQSKLP